MKDAGIMEDDLIAVHKTSEVRNGDIVIARYDDEVTVKFFEKLSDKKIRLIPANSDFKNLEINSFDFGVLSPTPIIFFFSVTNSNPF